MTTLDGTTTLFRLVRTSTAPSCALLLAAWCTCKTTRLWGALFAVDFLHHHARCKFPLMCIRRLTIRVDGSMRRGSSGLSLESSTSTEVVMPGQLFGSMESRSTAGSSNLGSSIAACTEATNNTTCRATTTARRRDGRRGVRCNLLDARLLDARNTVAAQRRTVRRITVSRLPRNDAQPLHYQTHIRLLTNVHWVVTTMPIRNRVCQLRTVPQPINEPTGTAAKGGSSPARSTTSTWRGAVSRDRRHRGITIAPRSRSETSLTKGGDDLRRGGRPRRQLQLLDRCVMATGSVTAVRHQAATVTTNRVATVIGVGVIGVADVTDAVTRSRQRTSLVRGMGAAALSSPRNLMAREVLRLSWSNSKTAPSTINGERQTSWRTYGGRWPGPPRSFCMVLRTSATRSSSRS